MRKSFNGLYGLVTLALQQRKKATLEGFIAFSEIR
jgi:hypothetical protein